MKLEELRTPAFLVDLTVFKENTRHMIERAKSLKVRLRPHVKTHKTVEGTRYQLGSDFTSVTVSTLAEARMLAEAGFRDVTYAFPITPDKLPEVAGLAAAGTKMNILVDSLDAMEAAGQFARAHQIQFPVFLKVDCGLGRAGVLADAAEGISLARRLQTSPEFEFGGILTHAGQSYAARNRDEIVRAAEAERSVMVAFAGKLREAGVPCKEVSVGSTPTAMHAEDWTGVTEIRPGNYVFFDQYQVEIGNCVSENCAATVLTRIAGVYPPKNQLIVDAGALALSKDPGAVHLRGKTLYGAVKDHPELEIVSLSQEHGVIRSDVPIDFDRLRIGSFLRIVPNHSCLTAALFPAYQIVEGDEVVDRWIPVRGW